jgi:hypothetical protein
VSGTGGAFALGHDPPSTAANHPARKSHVSAGQRDHVVAAGLLVGFPASKTLNCGTRGSYGHRTGNQTCCPSVRCRGLVLGHSPAPSGCELDADLLGFLLGLALGLARRNSLAQLDALARQLIDTAVHGDTLRAAG